MELLQIVANETSLIRRWGVINIASSELVNPHLSASLGRHAK